MYDRLVTLDDVCVLNKSRAFGRALAPDVASYLERQTRQTTTVDDVRTAMQATRATTSVGSAVSTNCECGAVLGAQDKARVVRDKYLASRLGVCAVFCSFSGAAAPRASGVSGALRVVRCDGRVGPSGLKSIQFVSNHPYKELP